MDMDYLVAIVFLIAMALMVILGVTSDNDTKKELIKSCSTVIDKFPQAERQKVFNECLQKGK